MDEEWLKEVFFKIFYLFSFDSTDVLKQTQSLILQTALPLAKWFGKASDNFS